MRRLANQVDERRHPRTTATVAQLLDGHFELVDVERSTRATYRGYAENLIRPLLGAVQLGVRHGFEVARHAPREGMYGRYTAGA